MSWLTATTGCPAAFSRWPDRFTFLGVQCVQHCCWRRFRRDYKRNTIFCEAENTFRYMAILMRQVSKIQLYSKKVANLTKFSKKKYCRNSKWNSTKSKAVDILVYNFQEIIRRRIYFLRWYLSKLSQIWINTENGIQSCRLNQFLCGMCRGKRPPEREKGNIEAFPIMVRADHSRNPQGHRWITTSCLAMFNKTWVLWNSRKPLRC